MKLALAATAALICTACASPDRILKTSGPVKSSSDAATTGQYQVFARAFDRAYGAAIESAKNGTPIDNDNDAYLRMAVEGMAAVDNNCSDFFSSAGDHEKWINFAQDAVAVVGGLATGIAGLAGASPTVLAGMALSTTTVYGGMDVYTQNFLFGTENISTVRTLIMNALATHQQTVTSISGPWTFGQAMEVVLDHQEVCRPSSIVKLVKQAIEKGDVVAAKPSGSSDAAVNLQDQIIMLQIAGIVGLTTRSVPSPNQVAGLYWLYIESHTADQLSTIKTWTGQLPHGPCNANGACFPDTGYQTNEQLTGQGRDWRASDDAAITSLLGQLSTSKKQAIKQIIAAASAGEAAPAAAESAIMGGSSQEAAPSETGVPNRHVTVTVQ